MKTFVLAFLLAILFSTAASAQEARREANPDAKLHRFSTTVEKERPELDEETKRLVAAFRRDPSDANRTARNETPRPPPPPPRPRGRAGARRGPRHAEPGRGEVPRGVHGGRGVGFSVCGQIFHLPLPTWKPILCLLVRFHRNNYA